MLTRRQAVRLIMSAISTAALHCQLTRLLVTLPLTCDEFVTFGLTVKSGGSMDSQRSHENVSTNFLSRGLIGKI